MTYNTWERIKAQDKSLLGCSIAYNTCIVRINIGYLWHLMKLATHINTHFTMFSHGFSVFRNGWYQPHMATSPHTSSESQQPVSRGSHKGSPRWSATHQWRACRPEQIPQRIRFHCGWCWFCWMCGSQQTHWGTNHKMISV